MKKINSVYLHTQLLKAEHVLHPMYFAGVAIFGHGPYIIVAGVMAVITLLLLVVVSEG